MWSHTDGQSAWVSQPACPQTASIFTLIDSSTAGWCTKGSMRLGKDLTDMFYNRTGLVTAGWCTKGSMRLGKDFTYMFYNRTD